MTKEEMLSSIYDEMADKTLSSGCLCYLDDSVFYSVCKSDKVTTEQDSLILYRYSDDEYYSITSIIWHPVRIGDVLKYIDTNCCFVDDGEWHKSRDMKALDHMLHSVFYNFVGKQDRPIDEQDELAIEFVFDLIKK